MKVPSELSGKRLDVALSEIAKISRSKAKEIIEKGLVKVNGQTVLKPSAKVKEGQELSYTIPEPEPVRAVPEDIPIEIVYEDEHVIVVNKPPGMVVHPSAGHWRGTLVNAILHHCSLESKDPIRPGIVHRLDKDTAGLMVVAKTEIAREFLISQFKSRKIERTYRALIMGIPKKLKGRIEVPIGRDRFDRKKFSPNTTSPKQAITNYWVVKTFKKFNISEVYCKLETGRTHQIRVHMSYLGHPVLGDKTYGFKISRIEDKTLRELVENLGMNALCAFRLKFLHPVEKKELMFEVSPPEGYLRVLRYLEELS